MARIVDSTNVLTPPAWAGDYGNREHLVPGGAKLLASAFSDTDAVVVDVGAAGAAAAATSIPVNALSGPIPSGTVLNFGTNKFARLTAAAAAGATSLTVAAIPTALVDADVATYAGVGTTVLVPSGTVIGRTFAEREAGTAFGPAAAADDEIYLVWQDVTDVTLNNDVELYRHGSVVKENFVPGWSALAAGVIAKIRVLYECTTGAA
jgi:hypothetical protein